MKIVLDPGHGTGLNKGVCNGYFEGDAMFAYAGMLRDELRRYGFDVVVTRQTVAENPGLTQRGKMGAGADMLCSLHSNAASVAGAYGVSVFYSIDLPCDYALGVQLGNAVSAIMGNYVRCVKYRESANYPGEDYYTVIDSAQDAGCKHVILLEHGFHTNPGECAWLSNSANLRKMAEAEAATIAKYFNVAKEPVVPVQGAAITHTVRRGETLSGIGKFYFVPWREIAALNGIGWPYIIHAGQVLTIKVGTAPIKHLVVGGESLSAIGKLYGVAWQKIAADNGIVSPYVIRPGQVLIINK